MILAGISDIRDVMTLLTCGDDKWDELRMGRQPKDDARKHRSPSQEGRSDRDWYTVRAAGCHDWSVSGRCMGNG